MRQVLRVCLLALMAFTLGVVLNALPPVRQGFAQQSRTTAPQRWEYCAITNAYTVRPREGEDKYIGLASVCYFQASGCRREEVRGELDYAEFLKEAGGNPSPNYNRYAAGARAAETALSKAIAKLGEDGWEMVGENPMDFVNNAEGNTRNKAIYFKRLKSR